MLKAALLSVTGMTEQEIAVRMKITETQVRSWLKRTDVKLYIDLLVEDHAKIVGEELLKGELEAVTTVREAMSAVTESGKPDWNVRLRAALRLLDAAGARGKPVESVKSESVQFTGDMDDMLRRALLDPAVQEVLKRTPTLARAMPVALPATSAVPPIVETVTEAELLPDDFADEDDESD